MFRAVLSRFLLTVVCLTSFAASPVAAAEDIEVVFAYGSEKDAWLQAVTRAFNERKEKIGGGGVIRIKLVPMGSGQCVDVAFDPAKKVHLISPAAAVWIRIGNAKARQRSKSDLVGPTKSLVRSPVVIAMWKPWPRRSAGANSTSAGMTWPTSSRSQTRKSRAGASRAFPQWGSFRPRFHSHPELSNSGLLGLMAMSLRRCGQDQKPDRQGHRASRHQAAVGRYRGQRPVLR